MQRRHDDQREAEIDMRRQPALQASGAAVGALAHPEPHQPEDQRGADRPQRVAQPGAAIGRGERPMQRVGEDGREAEPDAPFQETEPAIGQEGLVDLGRRASFAGRGGGLGRRGAHAAPPRRIMATYSSGRTRIAAPVGQARTQAAPPSMPWHMSHFTAFLRLVSPPWCFFAALSSPG
ncbi:MAG: hypothetical protein ACK559_22650, partial [bacterium]